MSSTTEDQHAAQQQGEPWSPTEGAPQQAPAAVAPYSAPDAQTREPEPTVAPAPRKRRGRFIALLVIGGVVLLGAGFGVGYAVGNATAAPTMGQFDPSRMGGGPGGNGGGFGGQGGPGGGTGTDSGTSDGTTDGTAS
ncbi:hypothetical protein HQQ81_11345 [Microbacteriaceae bacterium VKM Ac-2854]|nr:hypothetical protein [Microbacteriaceae bacterium VKM Ac-2854]